MKILVASWGNFERWNEIKYRFGNKNSVGPSTLPILQKTLNPDWTVIILSDTLSTNFSSLNALKSDISERLENFLERIGAGRELDSIIVPGVGSFNHGTFKGGAMDAYYYALYKLADVLPWEEDLEIHFDSTHGLNYITLLTYRALKDLLEISAIKNNVKFKVYNADPYIQRVSRELTINTIENTIIRPRPLGEKITADKNKYLLNRTMDKKEYGDILRNFQELQRLLKMKGKLNSWIASVQYGLPLLFATAFPKDLPIQESIEKMIKIYESAIAVGEGTVERRLSLGPGFGTLVKLAFQINVLKMERLPKDELSLKELYEVSEEIFKGRILASTRVELDRTASIVRSKTNWRRLSNILREQGKVPNTQVDDRNFLAHAGLEANLVEVKRNGELYLRYTKDRVRYGGSMKSPENIIAKILERTFNHR